MRTKNFTPFAMLFVLSAALLLRPASFHAKPAPALRQPSIGVNGFFSADKAQRGRIVQAAVVMEIPEGYHVNSNRPLSKFAEATTLKIEAPGGVRISPVSYPRAIVRKFSFSQDALSVFEGKVVMRFNVTLPANYQSDSTQLRARLRYQSCNNEVCFPPATQEVTLTIPVVGANESVQRTNGQIFGGGGSGRRRR